MQTKSTTAEAVTALAVAPAKTLEQVRERLLALRETANLVAPAVAIDYVPEMHRVSFRVVQIDPTLRPKKVGDKTYHVGTDTYRSPEFCGDNERALSKTGLLKIFRAAGISVVESRRTDDRQDQRYAEWRVKVSVPELDGGRTTYEATKVLDLRPGSPQLAKMTERQAGMAMTVLLENAETKALLRAARAALQLRHVYTVDELARPFVVPVLVADLDMSDPEIRRMTAAAALGIAGDLYGPGATERERTIIVAGDEVDPATGEVVAEGDPAAVNAAAGAPAGEDLTAFEEPAAAPAPAPAAEACDCPCGCRLAVSPAAAAMTREKRGHVRCATCYPGARFDPAKHQGCATLRLTPDITVAEASARVRK